MDNTLSEAIEKDLYNELKWLLCAATEWEAHDKIPKINEPCFHLKVYTMDSAFLHARSFAPSLGMQLEEYASGACIRR